MVRRDAVGALFHPKISSELPAIEELSAYLSSRGLRLWRSTRLEGRQSLHEEMARTRLIITFGGDGTFLRGARGAVRWRIPVLGTNLGRLGFLTEVELDGLTEAVGRFLDGDFRLERRLVLTARIAHLGQLGRPMLAINEVVLERAASKHLIRFQLWLDHVDLGLLDADGVLVSTATGSTAYALALGGPIVAPTVSDLVIVPMNPFALTVRPIVVGAGAEITIELPRDDAEATVDGQVSRRLRAHDLLVVGTHPHDLEVVRFSSPGEFYKRVRGKLGWGSPLVPDA